MSSVSYACEVLRGMNKQGILTPDSDGYYKTCVGAFNIHNFHKDFYPLTNQIKEMFDSGAEFQRRIKTHQLRGECEHPAPEAGMTQQQWFARLRKIRLDRVSHHFKSVVLDFSQVGKNGQNIVPILAEVKPSGVFGPGLQSSFDNKDEDTAFSIRSITADTPLPNSFRDRKEVQYIATFDWVNEPGIKIATKYHAPGLESLEAGEMSVAAIEEDIRIIQEFQRNGTGLEANDNIHELQALVGALTHSGAKTGIILPPSMRW